jgi:hypothetical protein
MISIQVGQTARMVFQPSMVGIDPATVTEVVWTQQGSPASVKFTHPDQVEGIAPGVGSFTATVNCGPANKMPYKFDIECIPAGPPPIPLIVPVTLTEIVTPGPPVPP